MIYGDRIQLEQVIPNVMLNALEGMTSHNGRLGKLLVSVREFSDNEVVVSVCDSGIGVDPSQSDRIYDAFFTPKPTGVGLGLSISQSIIQAHRHDGKQVCRLDLPPQRLF